MGKKSMLPAGKRTEVVLRLLSNEEPAAQIAQYRYFGEKRILDIHQLEIRHSNCPERSTSRTHRNRQRG